jgi:2-C-methyl-D-erythritol 2,4-cyclodiphosphate synthase
VVAKVAAAGYRVLNADCTVVAETPRLSPHTAAMATRLAAAIGAPVSVKATSTDGLGSIGRGEGIDSLAVALVESTEP